MAGRAVRNIALSLVVLTLALSADLVLSQGDFGNFCNSSPCANGGTCLSTTCTCATGFTGQRCQTGVTCGDPGAPASGSRIGTNFGFGSVVTFSCQAGFQLSFTNGILCQENGAWNQSIPDCAALPTTAEPTTAEPTALTTTRAPVLTTTPTATCGSNPGCAANQNFSKCCQFQSKPLNCCRSGVQEILNDRYDNLPDGQCKTALLQRLGQCVGLYLNCLNTMPKPPPNYQTCKNSHGCPNNCQITCNTAIAMDDGRWSNTTFCLPPECTGKSKGVLNEIARSDARQHCDTLEKLAGLHVCPLSSTKITCSDGSGGTFFPDGNPPPKGGTNKGAIIGVVIGCIVALIILIAVIVGIYRYKGKSSDSVDFGRLREEGSGECEE